MKEEKEIRTKCNAGKMREESHCKGKDKGKDKGQ